MSLFVNVHSINLILKTKKKLGLYPNLVGAVYYRISVLMGLEGLEPSTIPFFRYSIH